jgi:hypothetical protein
MADRYRERRRLDHDYGWASDRRSNQGFPYEETEEPDWWPPGDRPIQYLSPDVDIEYGRRPSGPRQLPRQGYGGETGRDTSWGGPTSGAYTSELGPSYGHSGAGPFAGRGPKGYRRSDSRIREDVCDRLTDAPFLDASDIDVTVTDGEVTLSGTVHYREENAAARTWPRRCPACARSTIASESRGRRPTSEPQSNHDVDLVGVEAAFRRPEVGAAFSRCRGRLQAARS